MKIAAAFALVVVALLGMIIALGWVDGQFGDGPGGSDVMTGTEQAYIEFVVARLESAGSNMGNLGYLITNAEFDNDDWKMGVYLVVNQLQAAFESIEGLEAPERLQPFHDASVAALTHSARFADLAADILEEESTEMSDEAVQELVAASNAFAEADRLLMEFIEVHPVPGEAETAPA